MWVAFLVIMLASGDVMVNASPVTYPSVKACQEANTKVEEVVKTTKEVKAYSFKCVEIKKTDVKANGLDV
jgi:hypothetical protein